MKRHIFKTGIVFFFLLNWMSTFAQLQQASISGQVRNPSGEGASGVTVALVNSQGQQIATVLTGASGAYTFSDVPTGLEYALNFSKDYAPLNGVTTFDQVLAIRQILGIQNLDSPYAAIGADVNGSHTITTFDVVLMRRMILAIIDEFPTPAWSFVPASLSFANPANPFAELLTISNSFVLSGNLSGFDFIAIKNGDLNFSAIP